MAQLIIRNIENQVKLQLQQRAKRHGRSVEEEVREILRNAVKDDIAPVDKLGSDISALFAGIGLDSAIEELRSYELKPARVVE